MEVIKIFKHVYPNLVGQIKANGDTYPILAEYLDIDRVTLIRKMKKGNFSIEEGKKLSRRYGYSMDYLFHMEEAHDAAIQVSQTCDRAVQTAENAYRDSASAEHEPNDPE